MSVQRRSATSATFRGRLSRWLTGSGRNNTPDVRDYRTANGKAGATAGIDFTGPPSLKTWSQPRLAVVQDIFGTGCNMPVGEDSLSGLLGLLDLGKGSLVADLGAGLGAVSRRLRKAGCRVIAYEANADLARQWEHSTAKLGGPPCEMRVTNLDTIDFGTHRFDYMVSKEGLLQVANKPLLLERMRKSMKLGGTMAISDFVRVGGEGSMVYKQWRLREPHPVRLMTLQQWEAALVDATFEIIGVEDISAVVRSETLRAFDRYANRIRSMVQQLEVGRLDWVLSEGEHWAMRLGVLDDGAVRVMRFFCRARENFI